MQPVKLSVTYGHHYQRPEIIPEMVPLMSQIIAECDANTQAYKDWVDAHYRETKAKFFGSIALAIILLAMWA